MRRSKVLLSGLLLACGLAACATQPRAPEAPGTPEPAAPAPTEVPAEPAAQAPAPVYPADIASAVSVLLRRFEAEKSALPNTSYMALLNFRQPSWEPRFYIIDAQTRSIVARYRVAHGRGSDEDHDGYADTFSDTDDSNASSVGFYVTGARYLSDLPDHGVSLRLNGISETNRAAWRRMIVIHGSPYLEPKFIKAYGQAGRSHGCLVFAPHDRDEVVEKLEGGALIYASY
jgi:hypothetical protein